MASQTQVSPELEPSPEFDARCMNFIRGWQHGELPSADVVRSLKQLSREAAASGHLANEARAEHLSGYMQHYLGNLSISITHYDRARQLFDRVGNRNRVVVMDINQGENFRFRGEFKKARRLYHQAYDAAAALQNVRLQTIAIANEGLMLISLKDYQQAYDCLQESLRLSNLWEDTNNLEALRTEVYFGLAQLALVLGQPETAWQDAHLSLEAARKAELMHSVGLAYRILGEALTALGTAPSDSDFKSPDDYYRAALEIFRSIDAEAEIGRTIYSHAQSQAKRHRRRNAANLFREAMVIFQKLGMTDDAANAAEAQLQVIS
jgi:tetratricopeptide (TPR) repeat protein